MKKVDDTTNCKRTIALLGQDDGPSALMQCPECGSDRQLGYHPVVEATLFCRIYYHNELTLTMDSQFTTSQDPYTARTTRSRGMKTYNVIKVACRWFIRARRYIRPACIESAGIERYEPESRKTESPRGIFAIFNFWFTMNLSALNMSIGMLGPRHFSLDMRQATLVAALAVILGCIPVALISCLGPRSGLRTTVINRFIIGWYPAKPVALLNMLVCMGYATLDVIAAGNLASALAPTLPSASSLTIMLSGTVVIAIAIIGNLALRFLERWVWLPQLLAICGLLGVVYPQLNDRSTPLATVRPLSNNIGAQIGFSSIVFSSIATYSAVAADFFAQEPEHTPSWRVIVGTIGGLWASYGGCIAFGIVLGYGCEQIPEWKEAYQTSPAALVVAAGEPLGVLGSVCCAALAFGSVSAAGAGVYAQAFAAQNVCDLFGLLPRVAWASMTGAVVLACAVAAKQSFALYLQTFTSAAGYLTVVWLAPFVLEYFLFHRGPYDWSEWREKRAMPTGVAASVALLVGMTVSMLSMAQPWGVGPIAKLCGTAGVDVCASRVTLPSL